MSPKLIKANRMVEEIKAESMARFKCLNYQWISEQLEEKLKENVVLQKPKKKNFRKLEDKIRNLNILKDFIIELQHKDNMSYKDLRLKYGFTSSAGIQIVCKTTAVNLDFDVKRSIEDGLPPKRVIRMYSAHLIQMADEKLAELEKELAEKNKNLKS